MDTNFVSVPQAYPASDYPTPATESLAVQEDGGILVGCILQGFDGWNRGFVRLKPSGLLDETFNPQLSAGDIPLVQVLAGGKILVSGGFITVAGRARQHLARLDASGGLDFAFDARASCDQPLSVMGTQPDGHYLVGGAFSNVDGVARAYLARLYGESPSNSPLAIVTQPVGTKALLGQTVQFFVSAAGYRLRYQWCHDGRGITGATNTQICLTNVQSGDSGDYTVVIGSGTAQITSPAATLMVYPMGTIVKPPVTTDPFEGEDVMFSVLASGTQLSYQWWHAGRAIAGATGDLLVLQGVHPADSGDYTVVVQSGQTPLSRATATLTVHTYGEVLNCPELEFTSEFGYTIDNLNYWQIGPAWDFQTNTTHDGRSAGRHFVRWSVIAVPELDFVLDEVRYIPWTPAFSIPETRYSPESGFQGTLHLNRDCEVFRLQWSEDLVNWTSWLTASNFAPDLIIHDPGATNRSRSFYSAVK